MTKRFARVCDSSQKEFRAGYGKLKVQGLNFEVDYNKENSKEVVVNGVVVDNAREIALSTNPSMVDIDDITNVTKVQRKGLKDGSIKSVSGKYNGLECLVYYDHMEKEYYITLDIELILYI